MPSLLCGTLNFKLFELTETMHQKDDTNFADLLGRLRVGKQSQDDIIALKAHQTTPDDPSIENCMRIYSLNVDVDTFNEKQLQKLHTQTVTIKAKDKLPSECTNQSSAVVDEHNSGLASTLTLKVNARVMLIRNVDTELGLFNGALGTITGFLPMHSTSPTNVLVLFDNNEVQTMARLRYPQFNSAYPIERFEARFPVHRRGNKYLEATRLQFPLKIAFATTIHKCQGQTLQSVVVSLRGYFGPGQAYVALSRCKKLSNLHLTDFDERCIKVNKQGLAALQLMKTPCQLHMQSGSLLTTTSS